MDKINSIVTGVAASNQRRAKEIISELDLIGAWSAIGAEANLVGSLRMGLLVNHLDIDFHIYSDFLNVKDSFRAVTALAENNHIKQIQFTNLIDTEEHCIEWHAWYQDTDQRLWQIDMIHILRGSTYDGYFERMADRIVAVLTPETREAILRLKYETPEDMKIMGVEYYQAVIRDGVRTAQEFAAWRNSHPVNGIVEWIP